MDIDINKLIEALQPEHIEQLASALLEHPQFKYQTEYIQHQQFEQAVKPLRDEWGDEFEQRYKTIKEHFETLPPSDREFYDSKGADGAKLLWERLYGGNSQTEQQQHENTTQAVPTFDRGSTQSGVDSANGRFKYRHSEILAMKPEDYKTNNSDIQMAFAQGLVDMSG